MLQANTVLEAWDKTFETMDFSHLAPSRSVYMLD